MSVSRGCSRQAVCRCRVRKGVRGKPGRFIWRPEIGCTDPPARRRVKVASTQNRPNCVNTSSITAWRHALTRLRAQRSASYRPCRWSCLPGLPGRNNFRSTQDRGRGVTHRGNPHSRATAGGVTTFCSHFSCSPAAMRLTVFAQGGIGQDCLGCDSPWFFLPPENAESEFVAV